MRAVAAKACPTAKRMSQMDHSIFKLSKQRFSTQTNHENGKRAGDLMDKYLKIVSLCTKGGAILGAVSWTADEIKKQNYKKIPIALVGGAIGGGALGCVVGLGCYCAPLGIIGTALEKQPSDGKDPYAYIL
jgi:hypothetical protein